MPKPLTIFVHRASECLTDHEAHGDGLICFSLLNGLAERGHRVYAYADTAPIRRCSPNLHVRTARHRVPANSLAPWEHSWRAERWMRELERTTQFDLVWRMHPYGGGCPAPPHAPALPLVVGPLFYDWPEQQGGQQGGQPRGGRPRLGIGLQSLVGPAARRGWERTLRGAALVICATDRHAEDTRARSPGTAVMALPVIVEPPQGVAPRAPRTGAEGVTLLFVANLVPHKRPRVFCETLRRLRAGGVRARGVVLGDGPERPALEAWCAEAGLAPAICFRGKVPNGEVSRALTEADFLISTSCGEPYGRGIAEAMSAGVPAVCHRSGGPADFIDDGRDGLLVGDLTAESYAERIRHLFDAPGAWERLSGGARRKAEGWRGEAVLARLEEALCRVVGTHGGG
jgi:glycosyltransferase involved in cell wall biosynthesis